MQQYDRLSQDLLARLTSLSAASPQEIGAMRQDIVGLQRLLAALIGYQSTNREADVQLAAVQNRLAGLDAQLAALANSRVSPASNPATDELTHETANLLKAAEGFINRPAPPHSAAQPPTPASQPLAGTTGPTSSQSAP